MEFVAHRAGNALARLSAAERVADMIEVDVHLGRGLQPEVRHAKRLWPTHRLWDRWYLLPRDEDVPTLEEILVAAPHAALWLDLKGFTPRLSRRVLTEVGSRRQLTVSSKSWWLLTPFVGRPGVRVLRSVGNRFELAVLLVLPSRVKIDGVVAHRRLLSDAIVDRLSRKGAVFTWAVTDTAAIERLARLGISGVIVDHLDLIQPGRRAAAAGEHLRSIGHR